jgi:hypothetical protein
VGVEPRTPSGLFPSGPPRPTYREPHPVAFAPALSGFAVAGGWVLLIGLLGTSVTSYGWLTILASSVAAAGAVVLARMGDRGVAVGVAVAGGAGLAVAMVVVAQRWATTGWPLW